MNNFFNTNLKHLRITAGLTQEDLGKKLDKDYSTIGKWELGQRSPIMEDVLKVAELFNVELNELLLTDLRFNNPPKKDKENNEKYKQILKNKGLMDENEAINEKNFDKLIQIADMIQGLNEKEK